MKYLLDNFYKQYSAYNAQDFANIAFIPARDGNEIRLARPTEVCHFNICAMNAG